MPKIYLVVATTRDHCGGRARWPAHHARLVRRQQILKTCLGDFDRVLLYKFECFNQTHRRLTYIKFGIPVTVGLVRGAWNSCYCNYKLSFEWETTSGTWVQMLC